MASLKVFEHFRFDFALPSTDLLDAEALLDFGILSTVATDSSIDPVGRSARSHCDVAVLLDFDTRFLATRATIFSFTPVLIDKSSKSFISIFIGGIDERFKRLESEFWEFSLFKYPDDSHKKIIVA
ncbi:MAG: hypothetical protein ACK5PB_12340 [Pirellula sp.]